MAIRLKDGSAVQKLFGQTKGFGAFANNEIIKNNPHLLTILASKSSRVSFRKKQVLNPKLLKLGKAKDRKQVNSKEYSDIRGRSVLNSDSRSLDTAANSADSKIIDSNKVLNKGEHLNKVQTQTQAQIKIETQTQVVIDTGTKIKQSSRPSSHTFNKTVAKEEIVRQEELVYKYRSDKKKRYYNIYLQPTLFGEYSVIKSWGGIGNRLGGYSIMTFDTLAGAKVEIGRILNVRKDRGYTPL